MPEPTRSISDILRFCKEYEKKTGRAINYGTAVAMLEREDAAAKPKKKKAHPPKGRKETGNE